MSKMIELALMAGAIASVITGWWLLFFVVPRRGFAFRPWLLGVVLVISAFIAATFAGYNFSPVFN